MFSFIRKNWKRISTKIPAKKHKQIYINEPHDKWRTGARSYTGMDMCRDGFIFTYFRVSVLCFYVVETTWNIYENIARAIQTNPFTRDSMCVSTNAMCVEKQAPVDEEKKKCWFILKMKTDLICRNGMVHAKLFAFIGESRVFEFNYANTLIRLWFDQIEVNKARDSIKFRQTPKIYCHRSETTSAKGAFRP